MLGQPQIFLPETLGTQLMELKLWKYHFPLWILIFSTGSGQDFDLTGI